MAFVSVLLCSCAGVGADIVLNSDNSGTMTLEYSLSRSLESLGKQDGNERWLPVPVGRADFERSIQRLPGMKLLSFSSKDNGRDLIISVKLQFANMEVLVRFFDPSGERAVYEKSGASSQLLFNLGGADRAGLSANSPVANFFKSVSEGYYVNISMTLPVEGTLDAPSLPEAKLVTAGKKLSCSIPLGAVLLSREDFILKFRW